MPDITMCVNKQCPLRSRCYRPYGYIKDGEWIDADWDKNETFAKEFDEWFDNLPDDTIINVVDCHE